MFPLPGVVLAESMSGTFGLGRLDGVVKVGRVPSQLEPQHKRGKALPVHVDLPS